MPWKELGPMEQRVEVLREWREGESITALAEIYGVARKTIYKWIERYELEGTAGLADRSRAPHASPQRLSDEMVASIIAARQRWGWGPRKLLVKLATEWPGQKLPAASTVAEVLRAKGLSETQKRRVRTPPSAPPFATIDQPNRIWCADFKGWFRTGDGTRCDPLTITDAFSRYLLCCQIVAKTDTLHVAARFDASFQEFGLPDGIHIDNGTPFASRAPGGLSRLSMRWIRLGIAVERNRPASPQDNPRHERMHRTLKHDTLRPPARNPRLQQRVFDRYLPHFNDERPHEALNYLTPSACYTQSRRAFPRRVPEVEYDSGLHVRRIAPHGDLSWKAGRCFISEIFGGEALGLRPSHDRYFEVFYGPVRIGWLDTFQLAFHRREPRLLRQERLHP